MIPSVWCPDRIQSRTGGRGVRPQAENRLTIDRRRTYPRTRVQNDHCGPYTGETLPGERTVMPRCRPFKLIDAMVLVATAALGMASMRPGWDQFHAFWAGIKTVPTW